MAVPFLKVYYTPPDGVETDITELVNTQDKRGLEVKSAKADITINNSKERYKDAGESVFIEDGTVEIYADYSPITKASSQLLISGQIQEITHQLGEGGSQTKLSVADKMSVLLGGLWSFTYDNTQTADSIIRSVVAQTAGGQVTTNSVVATTTAGSSFPTLGRVGKSFKPAQEWIKDMSQPEATGEDRAYLYYVDKDNDLHWFYPSQTASASILEGTNELYGYSMKRSNDEMINMVIYNAGVDLSGNGTLNYYYDTTSRSNKLRMKFIPMTEVSTQVHRDEIIAGNLTASSSGTVVYQGQTYALPGSSGTTSWNEAFTDDSDYKTKFRARLKKLADGKAKTITQRLGKLLWKGRIELKGTNNYTAGDLLTIDLPTIGILSTKLRVWDVAHSFGNDGWITSLELREDEQAITENITTY